MWAQLRMTESEGPAESEEPAVSAGPARQPDPVEEDGPALEASAGPGGGSVASVAEGVVAELTRLDEAVYRTIAETPTPTIDAGLRRLTGAADYSKIWLGSAAVLALLGGPTGRRAAVTGVVSIGVTSAVVNQGFKRFANRSRPDRQGAEHVRRHVAMPESTSFPSGHSASAWAFAESVGITLPLLGAPLRLSAAAVSYSRIHTGVHYPGDVIVGSLIGMTTGELISQFAERAAQRIAARRAAGGE